MISRSLLCLIERRSIASEREARLPHTTLDVLELEYLKTSSQSRIIAIYSWKSLNSFVKRIGMGLLVTDVARREMKTCRVVHALVDGSQAHLCNDRRLGLGVVE